MGHEHDYGYVHVRDVLNVPYYTAPPLIRLLQLFKTRKYVSVKPPRAYYHHAHLLIAADCSAFSYPNFHNAYTKGKVTLICCMDTDFDVMTKLSQILSNNSVKSVTIVKTDKNCCADLSVAVMQASKASKLPIPVQVSTVFIDAEDLTEEDVF